MALFPNLRNRQGFFSDYYLGTVFGRASGRQRTLVTREIEAAYRTLGRLHDRAEGRALDAPSVRDMFARPLLRDVLGFHVGAGDRRVHPLYASADDEATGRPPLLLAYIGDWDEDLDAGRNSPHRMLAELLARATADLRYGILVTGERLRLIRRKGDGPAGACVELDLPACLEAGDRESFAAAWRLFSARNFTPGPNGELPIQAIERESREHAEKVSEDLKRAVFQAAETLVQAIIADRTAHAEGPNRDPAAMSPGELETYRDAALTCLYRILFILYAEARDEPLLGHALYRDSYSLDGLVREFLNNRMVPSPNRFGLWERLRALFAIHHGGMPAINGLERIPARGGDLFDPATPPGRLLEEVRLDDATVARLLLDLATTTARRGVGYERVSFRELDIEQLGAVYEGLLEFEPRIAGGTTFEVRVQGRTYALAPAELVRLCREKKLTLTGDATLVEGTGAEALRPRADLEATEDNSSDDDEEASEDEDTVEEENEGVRRGASVVLVRRLERGQFHFVPGPGRKGSGSFYTPLPLVQDLVRHALDPLVEGKTAAEIESLRVLDPACGSAHFLVEAMRFLGQALHRAYVREHDGKAPPHFRATGRGWDAECEASDEEARASGSEARAWCKRRIAERCLFGVDLNPTAVNLARVSLWIESLAGDRPLTYFEHHIRCGNSILGTWLDRLGSPPLPDLGTGLPPAQTGLFAEKAKEQIREAARIRRLIDVAADAGAVEPDTLEELRFKEEQRRQAETLLADARLLFDLRSASAFLPEIWAEREVLLGLLGGPGRLASYARSRPWWQRFEEIRARERFFHWGLEFPEVFLGDGGAGFDAVLGNPPWDKIKPDRKEFYGRHDVLIRAFVGGELDRRIRELQVEIPGLDADFEAYEQRVKTIAAYLKKGGDYRFQDWEVDGKSTGGDPDAFKFFVERAWGLVREGGRVGFVVPSAIYNNEGCTGLRHLLLEEAQVERFYAFENRRKIFPIHAQYKFVSLVFRKGRPDGDGFLGAFMRHDLAELADPAPKDFMVLVRRSELERLSPGTLAFLEYRHPRDREILLKMYGYDKDGNPVNPRPLLGDQGPGTWNARFYTEFHMTNDRDLWTDPKTGKLYNPRQILGPVSGTTTEPPYYDPRAWPEIRARMAEKGFWPLYQDAHIHQHVLEFKPFMRWVSLEEHRRKYGGLPASEPKLVLRDRGTNTHERMVVAAVLPPHSCFGHSLNGIEVTHGLLDRLCAILNTLSFDFLARQKNSGLHVSPYILKFCAVPPPVAFESFSRIQPIHAPHRKTWIYEMPEYWETLWAVEESVGSAYGLGAEDLFHIVGSFPVFQRERPEFHSFLQDRITNLIRGGHLQAATGG
ncbi:MAG: N-6 DNA methylase [Armatimonadota bacterium]|nr:N-6 DNA methylase [Armatimonadota bacterium]MDR7543043.1 N-6 DNA methylase [Armatimonadota bacterium]